jgi:signal transduction histidine kinase/CheY-like chemotaxis protein
MGVLVLVSVILAWIGTSRILDEQIEARSRENLAHLASDIRKDLSDIERVGETTQRWWAAGTLQLNDGAATEAQLAPLLEAFPGVANLVIIGREGWGLSCSRETNGLTIYHLDARPEQAMKRYFRRDGQAVRTQRWEPTPFQVFQRPWFKTAQASSAPQWVGAYRFVNLPTHGLSYTIPLRDRQGVFQGAICVDILLTSLSERTWAVQPTLGSQVLVSDQAGKALILPRGLAPKTEPRQPSPFLRPVAPDFLPLFHTLLNKWKAAGQTQRPMHIRQGLRGYTCTVKPLEGVEGVQWYLSLAVPDAEYLGGSRRIVLFLLAAGALVSILAVWRSVRLAERFGAPLEALARAANALGEGAAPAPIPTQIAEFAALGEAIHKAGQSLEMEAELQLKLQHSQRLETVGTLAGGIAHDVNNQLAAIIGQLNLGREKLAAGHPAALRMEKAEEAAQRCAQMIKALLGFSHQTRPELQVFDLNELVRRTGSLVERILGGRIRLDLELAPELGPVQGDHVSLEQVLMNLAVNARDAMPEGGRLLLSTQLIGAEICLAVQDTGMGIPEEILPKIFDPFFTTKEVGKGTGLGLAMVFGIIKSHGGRIEVESRIGQGTTFRIFLSTGIQGVIAEAEVQTRDLAEVSLAGRRILVVEDEMALRELVAEAFTARQAQVDTARDGAEGWAIWKGSHYDLIISDQRMPEMTGLELLARIRATGSQVPVILASGYGLEGAEPELGLDPRLRILPKPFSFKRLFALTGELLEGK